MTETLGWRSDTIIDSRPSDTCDCGGPGRFQTMTLGFLWEREQTFGHSLVANISIFLVVGLNVSLV